MARKKLSTSEMLRRVDAGDSYADIAKDHGITRQAVYKRVVALRGKTTKVVASSKIERAVDQKIDAMEQLSRINHHANWLLDHVMKWIQGDETAIQVLEKNARQVNVGSKDEPEWATEYKFTDPHQIAIKAMGEIRGQIKLMVEIYQALYDLKAAESFMSEVVEVIGSVSPDVRREIIKRLNARHAIRSAVRFT